MALPPSRKRRCRDVGSAAAATVSSSTDLIFEILSWLPAKSLGRFRCVSKNWRDLISSPAFVAARRTRAEPLLVAMTGGCKPKPNSLQLMDTKGTVVRVVSLDLAGKWMFRASLDDLACVTYRNDDDIIGVLILDLATEAALTNLPIQTAAGRYCEPPLIGFGRSIQSGVYKLLNIHTNRTQTCEVHTVGNDTEWRQTQPPPLTVSRSSTTAVAVDDALYFLPAYPHNNGDVLRFDLESEEWKVIHGPEGGLIRIGEPKSIAELNGSLCMTQMAPNVINLWILSDPENSIWIKPYVIPTQRTVITNVMPLSVLHLGGSLLFYYYGYNAKKPKLKVYNPRSRRYTTVKTPTNLFGKLSLCGSHLDPRLIL